MKEPSKEFVAYTKAHWQNYYEEILADEDAIEIYKNFTGLMRLLVKLEIKRSQTKIEEAGNQKELGKNKEQAIQETHPQERLIPVTKWNDYYDYPKLGGLRALVFNEDKNGFNKVVRRIGRRVLIKEDAFFEWVEENNLKS